MADFSGGLERLPARERLERIRELAAERRKELEEKLEERKKELEELEAEAEQEQENLEDMHKGTKQEIEADVHALEQRIQEFSDDDSYLPEAQPEQGYATQRAQEALDYLLHGEPSRKKQDELAQDLYRNLRVATDNFSKPTGADEAAVANQMYQSIMELKARKPDGYLAHTVDSFISGFVQDYK